jgi:hypothetical protein
MRKVSGLFLLFFLAAAPLLADPPMKVVYKSGYSTHFSWKWPFHPVQVFHSTQTKPYYYTGRVLYISQEDVSKYRHYFPERTCKNGWGYFFDPGTKLCPRRPYIIFESPKAYTEVIYYK